MKSSQAISRGRCMYGTGRFERHLGHHDDDDDHDHHQGSDETEKS
jgi:hypothetical protein